MLPSTNIARILVRSLRLRRFIFVTPQEFIMNNILEQRLFVNADIRRFLKYIEQTGV